MATKKIKFSDTQIEGLDVIFDYSAPKVEGKKVVIEYVKTSLIKEDPKKQFTNLFPLDEKNIENLSKSMKTKGFRKDRPLTLITIEDEDIEFIGDGHNRLNAAIAADIEEVPVCHEFYSTRKEAEIAMLELQLHRRNLSDQLLFRTITRYQELKGNHKAENGAGKKSEQIAKETGVSARQVEKINAISKDEEATEALMNGSSINQAHEIIRKKKAEKIKEESDFDDDYEDDNESPRSLQMHERKIDDSPKFVAPAETQEDKRLIERYQEGFADGFYKALCFALASIKNGKTPEEIWNDDQVEDFSPFSICKFELKDEDEEVCLAMGNKSNG